jgi:hypothetical protein
MKPHQENAKPAKPRTQDKPKRFRIVRLEPRMAPTPMDQFSLNFRKTT